MRMLIFPELRQTDNYDCGAKVIEAILAYYGFDVCESEIMKLSKTTKKQGTSLKNMICVFKKFNLKCIGKEMKINEIKNNIRKKRPVILALQAWSDKRDVDWEKNWTDGHYVVAIGYDRNKIYFEDPASLFRTFLKYNELEKRWHDKGNNGKKYINYGITVYGKKRKFNFIKKIHMD